MLSVFLISTVSIFVIGTALATFLGGRSLLIFAGVVGAILGWTIWRLLQRAADAPTGTEESYMVYVYLVIFIVMLFALPVASILAQAIRKALHI